MRLFFKSSSILTPYNLDLPNALGSEVDVYVDIEHSLLYAIYLYERFHGRYRGLRVIPLYVNRLARLYVVENAEVV
jgi:hypothetical protein